MVEGIEKGFQKTDVGAIPKDWVVLSINELTPKDKQFSIVDGPFGSNLKTIHYRKSGIPIITSGYVTDGIFFASEYLYVDLEKFKQEKRSAVKGGDIVMAKIGERCGASAILPKGHPEAILSGNALKITIDENRFSTELIAQILWWHHTKGSLELLRTVGAQPAISMANLKKYEIPLPPTKTEQTAIATTLNDSDALIAQLGKLIAKKRAIKQGAMQELLRPKEGWVENKLGEICFLSKSRVNPRTSLENYKCLELEHLSQETGRLLGFADSKDLRSQKSIFKQNDVLFGKLRPYLRKFYYAEFDGICTTEIWAIKANNGIDSKFLYYLVQTDKIIDSANQSTGTKMPRADWKTVSNTEISLPISKTEQTRIAQILSDMDAEIESLETNLDKYKQIKQGMMQILLTGKIRLV